MQVKNCTNFGIFFCATFFKKPLDKRSKNCYNAKCGARRRGMIALAPAHAILIISYLRCLCQQAKCTKYLFVSVKRFTRYETFHELSKFYYYLKTKKNSNSFTSTFNLTFSFVCAFLKENNHFIKLIFNPHRKRVFALFLIYHHSLLLHRRSIHELFHQ